MLAALPDVPLLTIDPLLPDHPIDPVESLDQVDLVVPCRFRCGRCCPSVPVEPLEHVLALEHCRTGGAIRVRMDR